MTGSVPTRARGSDDWVERVRAATDIVEFIGQTVQLKRVGRNWMGLCPFHDEKTPSFSVNADRQFYHCFSCKVGGDVFKFVQETENVGFLESVELLSRRAGIAVPERRGAPRGQRAQLLEALEASAAAYEAWLADPTRGRAARTYLEQRGIQGDALKTYRLGLAPEGWENLHRRLKGRIPEQVMVDAGLINRRETGRGGYFDRFRNRLMIPLVAPGGAVVGFGARALADEDQPKYLNSPETPVYHKGAFLFGMEQARKAGRDVDEVIVVEGYFDVIVLQQAGLTQTVATSGTALTAEQARLLKRVAPRVAMAYDGDTAGRGAMLRSLGVLLAEGLDVVVVDLPSGEDPDSLVRRHGVAGWQEARRTASDPVLFIQKHVLRGETSGDPRERALQTVVGLAGGIADPIRVKLLFDRAAQVLDVSAAVLQRAVALRRSGQSAERPLRAVVQEQRRGERDLERRLLQALLQAPEEVNEVRRHLSPEDFRDPASAGLARRIWQQASGEHEDEATAALERELIAETRALPDWGQEVRVATRTMVERRLKGRLKETRERLRRADSQEEAARLMKEIQDIGASLKGLQG